jgi:hypothetical protein
MVCNIATLRLSLLVNVSCNDRRAEQVTGAHGYGIYRSAGIGKLYRYAEVIHQRVIESANIVVVSLDPQDDALPRHVFHAHTNRPTAGEVGELRKLSGCDIGCAGRYSHTSPTGLGIEHRPVPSIADARGDGADLVDADRSVMEGRVRSLLEGQKNARLRFREPKCGSESLIGSAATFSWRGSGFSAMTAPIGSGKRRVEELHLVPLAPESKMKGGVPSDRVKNNPREDHLVRRSEVAATDPRLTTLELAPAIGTPRTDDRSAQDPESGAA